jgi:hypothetical protein
VAEVTGDVDGADRPNCLYAVVARGGTEHIAAGGADAERANAIFIDFGACGEGRDSGLDVLDAVGWILEASGLAAALTLVGRVIGECDEALVCEAPGVEAGRHLGDFYLIGRGGHRILVLDRLEAELREPRAGARQRPDRTLPILTRPEPIVHHYDRPFR